MLADPHFQAREAIIDAPHPKWDKLKMQNVFPRLSKTPGGIRSIAPQSVGEHNQAIYGDLLGMTEEQLAALAERGVV